MISWSEYLQLRESAVLEPPTTNENPSSDSSPSNKSLIHISTLAWSRYQSETKEFFNRLAEKDHDIKEELKKLDGGSESSASYNDDKKDKEFSDKDVIAPPTADVSPGAEEM